MFVHPNSIQPSAGGKLAVLGNSDSALNHSGIWSLFEEVDFVSKIILRFLVLYVEKVIMVDFASCQYSLSCAHGAILCSSNELVKNS